MGPKKIVARLAEIHPDVSWPAASTVGDILLRHGLVQRRVRRRPLVHPIRVPVKPKAPNDVMTIDFKGHFRLGNRRYCYPLTIVDAYSRYLQYPGHYETRKVDHTGLIKWHDDRVFISHTLEGEVIGFEEIDDGIWSVYYGPVLLARFDERERRFYS